LKVPAQHQLNVFLALTFGLSALMQVFIITKAGTVNSMWTLLLMWIPGLAAIACSYYFRNSAKHLKHDLALWTPANRYLAIGYAVPAGAALLILAVSAVIGIGELQFPMTRATMNRFIFAPTLGVVVAMIAALGEELGWRGFMHSRLQEMNAGYPYFFTGVVWAVWHWPLILFSDYATSRLPAISCVLFTIMIVSFSIFLGQLRQASRSVWPCALAHAVHNTWIQGIYPHFLKAGALDPFFGGEAGVILAILYLSFAISLQSRRIE
jgi:membrane protease YdiL (CAAX protease family)